MDLFELPGEPSIFKIKSLFQINKHLSLEQLEYGLANTSYLQMLVQAYIITLEDQDDLLIETRQENVFRLVVELTTYLCERSDIFEAHRFYSNIIDFLQEDLSTFHYSKELVDSTWMSIYIVYGGTYDS